jgi:transcriptional regulator with XRE-family HTH domain
MKHLTPEEMLQMVKDLVQKHHITAYEIGENTDLNTSGVHRILSGEVQSPRMKTLRTILEYIEDKLVGKNNNPQSLSELEAVAGAQQSIQKIIASEVFNMIAPKLEQFQQSHQAILHALAVQALDLEELKNNWANIEGDGSNASGNGSNGR